MAWSDAARAAALEARRAHAKQKPTVASSRAVIKKYNAAVQTQNEGKASTWNARRYPGSKPKAAKQERFTFHVPSKAYSSGMVRAGSTHTLRGKSVQEARLRLYRMLDLKALRKY